jgi:hypothetical protein
VVERNHRRFILRPCRRRFESFRSGKDSMRRTGPDPEVCSRSARLTLSMLGGYLFEDESAKEMPIRSIIALDPLSVRRTLGQVCTLVSRRPLIRVYCMSASAKRKLEADPGKREMLSHNCQPVTVLYSDSATLSTKHSTVGNAFNRHIEPSFSLRYHEQGSRRGQTRTVDLAHCA